MHLVCTGGGVPDLLHTEQPGLKFASCERRAAGSGGAGYSEHGSVHPQAAPLGVLQVGWRPCGGLVAAQRAPGRLDTGFPAGFAENCRTSRKSARTGCKFGGLGDAGMHRAHDFARAGEIRGCHELVCAVSVCAVHVQGYLAHKNSNP